MLVVVKPDFVGWAFAVIFVQRECGRFWPGLGDDHADALVPYIWHDFAPFTLAKPLHDCRVTGGIPSRPTAMRFAFLRHADQFRAASRHAPPSGGVFR